MKLRQLLPGEIVLGNPTAEIEWLTIRPDNIRPNTLFFKCRYPGLQLSTAEAVRAGVRHFVFEQGDPESAALPADATRTFVRDVNRTYAAACAIFFGKPDRELTLIGVTGTKGKTTTCHLIDAALRNSGLRTGLVTSAVRRLPMGEFEAKNTTPEPFALHRFLRKVRRQGGTHVVLEVSSIGVAQSRVHGLRFAALGFTNLGHDHHDYHGGRDAYFAQKRRLFADANFHATGNTLCAINVDDEAGRELRDAAAGRVVTFGLHDADVVPERYAYDAGGMSLRVGGHDLRLPLFGEHNVSNALGALAVAGHVLGSIATAASAMQRVEPLPGRLERVPTSLDIDVYVDYAHTPESVESALRAVASVTGARRRVAVIGCSANSDRGKRPLIARAAAAAADVCVFTTDNPNHEDPEAIFGEMLSGLDPVTARSERVRTIADRAGAIATAIELAGDDGAVVLMGKGAERVQLVRGERLPHNDLEVAANVLRSIERRRHGREEMTQ